MSDIKIANIPDGHIIAGYIAYVKVIDDDGEMYWALRVQDLNDMEALGMASDLLASCQRDLQNGQRRVGREDD